MFHPGKVIVVLKGMKEEIASDQTVQATVMMWDENLLTLEVHPKLKSKIQEGDIVLVDYRPMERLSVPVPRQSITKIVRGNKAKFLWEQYTEYHERRKRSANRAPTAPPGYIG